MKFIFFISLPLYALDQLTKYLILQYVDPNDYVDAGDKLFHIKNFFHLVNVTNTGAAFGSFKDNNAFFIAISCIALLFVLILLVRRHQSDAWRDVSLALLLAGILGNLTDRLLYGHVIDFLLFNFGPYAPKMFRPWPAFNVADSCITIAVICFIIHSFWKERQAGSPPARSGSP